MAVASRTITAPRSLLVAQYAIKVLRILLASEAGICRLFDPNSYDASTSTSIGVRYLRSSATGFVRHDLVSTHSEVSVSIKPDLFGMDKQRVLLLGATGETGSSILKGLLDFGKFEVEALVRPSSAQKPDVKKLVEKGVQIRIADTSGPVDDLVPVLSGVDIFITAISGTSQLAQINIATAAKKAGVKRFVPCCFATICPPGGVMALRDDKEEVNNHIKKLFLPYTFIDIGFWYQFSIPILPSGRTDYAVPPGGTNSIHGDGEAPNLLTDLRDIGKFVAHIVDDKRTLNKSVFGWGDLLTENQIYSLLEELSGEKLDRQIVSIKDIEAEVAQATELITKEPDNVQNFIMMYSAQYNYSKYVRQDNTPEYARYLGYLDARELYPDFTPKSFRDFLVELLDGKMVRPYSSRGYA
ncbi:hypothetical protein BPAE_0060g00050 [Botrytis paeoniae]|uniref:NmrA-like domain-containing protein n=1 Tax=Botrytis paeoniae TaxID=278948 RepID=A0A4Z1FSV0_9HELO|nr:hypothetical protein BPAE_0060g00050 [Botrytis paeoniae]